MQKKRDLRLSKKGKKMFCTSNPNHILVLDPETRRYTAIECDLTNGQITRRVRFCDAADMRHLGPDMQIPDGNRTDMFAHDPSADRVFLAKRFMSRMTEFDLTTGWQKTISTWNKTHWIKPAGMVVHDSCLYVSDCENRCIYSRRQDMDTFSFYAGCPLSEYEQKQIDPNLIVATFEHPTVLGLAPDGDLLCLDSDRAECWILKLSRQAGATLLCTWEMTTFPSHWISWIGCDVLGTIFAQTNLLDLYMSPPASSCPSSSSLVRQWNLVVDAKLHQVNILGFSIRDGIFLGLRPGPQLVEGRLQIVRIRGLATPIQSLVRKFSQETLLPILGLVHFSLFLVDLVSSFLF